MSRRKNNGRPDSEALFPVWSWSWSSEAGGFGLEAGGWKLEVGSWKVEAFGPANNETSGCWPQSLIVRPTLANKWPTATASGNSNNERANLTEPGERLALNNPPSSFFPLHLRDSATRADNKGRRTTMLFVLPPSVPTKFELSTRQKCRVCANSSDAILACWAARDRKPQVGAGSCTRLAGCGCARRLAGVKWRLTQKL